MALVKRLVKGTPLTYSEGDGNLDHLQVMTRRVGSAGTRDAESYYGIVPGSGVDYTTVWQTICDDLNGTGKTLRIDGAGEIKVNKGGSYANMYSMYGFTIESYGDARLCSYYKEQSGNFLGGAALEIGSNMRMLGLRYEHYYRRRYDVSAITWTGSPASGGTATLTLTLQDGETAHRYEAGDKIQLRFANPASGAYDVNKTYIIQSVTATTITVLSLNTSAVNGDTHTNYVMNDCYNNEGNGWNPVVAWWRDGALYGFGISHGSGEVGTMNDCHFENIELINCGLWVNVQGSHNVRSKGFFKVSNTNADAVNLSNGCYDWTFDDIIIKGRFDDGLALLSQWGNGRLATNIRVGRLFDEGGRGGTTLAFHGAEGCRVNEVYAKDSWGVTVLFDAGGAFSHLPTRRNVVDYVESRTCGGDVALYPNSDSDYGGAGITAGSGGCVLHWEPGQTYFPESDNTTTDINVIVEARIYNPRAPAVGDSNAAAGVYGAEVRNLYVEGGWPWTNNYGVRLYNSGWKFGDVEMKYVPNSALTFPLSSAATGRTIFAGDVTIHDPNPTSRRRHITTVVSLGASVSAVAPKYTLDGVTNLSVGDKVHVRGLSPKGVSIGDVGRDIYMLNSTFEIAAISGNDVTLGLYPGGATIDYSASWTDGMPLTSEVRVYTPDAIVPLAYLFEEDSTKADLIAVTDTSVVAASAWVTSTAYTLVSRVREAGNTYHCAIPHTSGTFATDLAASKWIKCDDLPSVEFRGRVTLRSNVFNGIDALVAATGSSVNTVFWRAPVDETGSLASRKFFDSTATTRGPGQVWGRQAVNRYGRAEPNYQRSRTIAQLASGNTLICVPFRIDKPRQVSEIGVYCTTSQASVNLRMYLFDHLDSGAELGRLLDASGNVSLASPGSKTLSINRVLDVGYYWVGLNTDATTAELLHNFSPPSRYLELGAETATGMATSMRTVALTLATAPATVSQSIAYPTVELDGSSALGNSYLSAAATAGATSLALASSTGFANSDTCAIMLEDGTWQFLAITTAMSSVTALRLGAPKGAPVIEDTYLWEPVITLR